MTCLEVNATFVYTREVTVNYSLGGTSGDVRRHSTECMRVVGERFPSLSPSDISGLYDCFFLFAGLPDLPDRPANRTEFLRDIFARHAADADFLQALSWASIEKLEHPADERVVDLPPAAAPTAEVAIPTVKELVKVALRKSPAADRVARRIYSSIRKG